MIAAVVVNFGGAPATEACVSSLLAADPRPALTVIVDNDSPDDSAERLARFLGVLGVAHRAVAEGALGADDERWLREAADPRVVLLRAASNHGFGGGVNRGWSVARRDPRVAAVLLINNDATAEPGFLGPLAAALAAAPDVGVATGTIRLPPPGHEIWYAGGELRWWQCRGAHLTAPATEPRDVSFCTGCLLLVRRDVMDEMGGMPEPYFLYYEDVEFSVRVVRAGYRMRYQPASVITHAVGSSAGHRGASPSTAFVSARNRFWFARRNLTSGRRVVATLNVLADELGRALGALGRGAPAVTGAVLRGVAAGLFLSPEGPAAGRRTRAVAAGFARAGRDG